MDNCTFTAQQLKMVSIACKIRESALRCYGPLPDFKTLCEQWYLAVSPAMPLYSVFMVYNWLVEHGYYEIYNGVIE